MDKDRIAGSAKDFAGKVKSAVDDIADDAKTQALVRAREASGSVQNLYGQAKEAFASDVYGTIRDGTETMVFEVENEFGALRDENDDDVLHEIKSEVLRLVGANLLDSPESHLAYIRGRLKSVA
jgi:uncharacterized protein YjbJ (UPF0337 family)